ncbi:MAG TPA: cation-translocating P-type ATPase [Actinobacteria bacterium]|nr:cation-translocating P-type ATPase [Actinomycetota bacterium]
MGNHEIWHTLDVSSVEERLKSSIETGLDENEAAKRLLSYGPNELAEKEKSTALGLFLSQFSDFMIWVLIVAALIAGFVLKETIDALAIFVILTLNAVLGFVQEFRAEKALDALKRMTAPEARALREGGEKLIPAKNLVQGDVVLLYAGDHVPADARIIESSAFFADEASLTGESQPEMKSSGALDRSDALLGDRKNMIYMGTTIVSGRAKAFVVATGASTEMGKIAESIKVPEEKTPLQIELKKVGKTIALICLAICGIVFLAGVINGKDFSLMFLTAVSLAVAAIPEGLPAIVTVSLALGVQNMAKKNALVRRLHAVETLGSTTVICTDKTGTLTLNRMTVQPIYSAGELVRLKGNGQIEDESGKEITLREDIKTLFKIAVLCNDARISDDQTLGDPTEIALLQASEKTGFAKNELDKQFPRINEIPFDSERKEMTTIHKTNEKWLGTAKNGLIALTKGAPEIVLSQCASLLEKGKARKVKKKDLEKILKVNEDLASTGFRILALAFKLLPEDLKTAEAASIERDLVFVGLAGMIDPPRKEVYEAIETSKSAHVKVVMITGDHKLTAENIAKEIGLLGEEETLTGDELASLSEDELAERVESVAVYSRVAPLHKVKIVEALKKKGHTVAMTGDGVNDAPAVKRADIGVSMGLVGTDVTKEASDMVLADDNFATIIKAIREGRLIFDNIKKFIYFLLSCNVSEVLTMFLGIMVWGKLVLLPTQILWMNLITDGFPALALGVDPAASGLMTRPPRKRDEGILTGRPLSKIFFQGVILTVCTLSTFIVGMFWFKLPLSKVQTMTFTFLVLIQLLHSLNFRTGELSVFSKSAFVNKSLLAAIGGSSLLQLLVIYFAPFNKIFHTLPLGWQEWAIIAIIVLATMVLLDITKRLSGRKQYAR